VTFDLDIYRATACNAIHGIATRKPSVHPSDCTSVRLSDNCVDCDKTKESLVHILIPHERLLILVLLKRRMVDGGDPLYLKFWVKLTPLERKCWFSS